jgi:predicted HTH transcriptional regulator
VSDLHRMHEHSLEAYRSERHELSARSQSVFDWLKQHGPATDRQVMFGLGFREPNSVRPRITELIDSGLVREVGSTKDQFSGKTVRRVDVIRSPEQLSFQ